MAETAAESSKSITNLINDINEEVSTTTDNVEKTIETFEAIAGEVQS